MLNDSKMSKGPAICDVDEFMQRPLVTWFHSCLICINKENCTYEELVDGVLIYQVFLQMGLESVDAEVSPSPEEPRQRARNLRAVLANLRHFYEERGDVVLRAPQVARLAREPRLHVLDAELLLCLLLGCAVQCPHNEDFIEHIKSLDVSTQQAIAECIKQVVHVPNIVLSPDMLSGPLKELEVEAVAALEHVRRAYHERSRYLEQLRALAREDASRGLQEEEDEEELQEVVARLATRHRDTELVDCRARMREQRDQLKKAHEELHECREELRQCKEIAARVQKENEILVLQAQSVELYRDELDAAAERAEKAVHLEQEIARYKEKLAGAEYLKGQLNEFQEMNQLLHENNKNLEEKLAAFKAKAASTTDLKKQLAELQQRKEELELESEKSLKRQRELFDENTELKNLLKIATKEALETSFSMEPEEPSAFINSSLSEQLSNSAQSRALKLELENHRLASLIDSLKESSSRSDDSKILDLERENRRLSGTLDSVRSPPRPAEPEQRRCGELGREKHRRLNVGRALAQLRLRVDKLEAEKRAAVERAQKLERLLEEARRTQTVRRSPSGQEHAQLQEDFRRLYQLHQRLLERLAELEAELAGKDERIVECDGQIKQLRLHCADLASEKRFLLDHSSQLAQQNHALFDQMMDYYAEDRKIRDEMNHLNRHKEKLEEKIMDQFRRMPSSAGKKRTIGTNLVKNTLSKMRRASSGLFNRSRRSWAEESSERCTEFDFVRGHESDGANEPRNRKSVDFLDGFRPSDFSFQVNLEERSRKSVDFMDLPCTEEPEKTDDDEDELDRTLPAESKNEEDLSLFAKSKSVDLSLEDLLEEPEHEVPDKDNAALAELIKNKKLRKARSRKSLWIEQGCV